MKRLVGGYTQLSHGLPAPLFTRVLEAVLLPALTELNRSEHLVFQLALSVPFMEFLEKSHPSVNLLLTDLSRNEKLEFLSHTFFQSIPSLLAPKDRAHQIERTTTYMRRRYQTRSRTLFCPYQIFSPAYIGLMNLCFLDALMVSTHNPHTGKTCFSEPVVMQELGKRGVILPIDDEIGKAVEAYSRREIPFSKLLSTIGKVIESDRPFVLALLNFDQLATGGITAEETGELFSVLVRKGSSSTEGIEGAELSLKRGYLPMGWYGYDVKRTEFCCFNELLVRDETLHYLQGRYMTTSEHARSYRKDRDVKKRLEHLIARASVGSIYIGDAYDTFLHSQVRKLYWRSIHEIDSILASLKDFSYPNASDYDYDGLDEHLVISKFLSCVIDAKGGALSELTYLPSLHNYGDSFNPLPIYGTMDHLLHPPKPGVKQRIFTDLFFGEEYVVDEYDKRDEAKVLNLEERVYDLEVIDRRSTEYMLRTVCDLEGGELRIAKHYKIRQNTVLLDITLANTGEEELFFQYGTELVLALSPPKEAISFILMENRKSVTIEEAECSLDQVKSLKIYDEPNHTQLTLVSDTRFFLVKEDCTIADPRSEERHYQHTTLLCAYRIALAPDQERKITLGLRIERK
ncbi:MAG: DUF1926 domain-containing protein [Spirochaetales bacterium]|nr:DUF1926 domain-containing protein [Spirochaetales bacterium]